MFLTIISHVRLSRFEIRHACCSSASVRSSIWSVFEERGGCGTERLRQRLCLAQHFSVRTESWQLCLTNNGPCVLQQFPHRKRQPLAPESISEVRRGVTDKCRSCLRLRSQSKHSSPPLLTLYCLCHNVLFYLHPL